jgi:hypothetical protein
MISRDVERFRRQYLQLLEPRELSWPSREAIRNIETQTWLYDNLFNAANFTYLPPARYQLRVLKHLLQLIEEAIEDPDEDVGTPHLVSIQY